MKIIVLNGSPRPAGNTKAMISAFADGAKSAGHVGRCGHICNASYAVSSDARGRHIGFRIESTERDGNVELVRFVAER